MSAIFGIIGLDGRPVRRADLESMAGALAHRGPDGSRIWHGRSAGVGHAMLYTTPESLHERLPFDQDGLVITADARLDNRDELIGLLRPCVSCTGPVTDSELILCAYRCWGEDCPARLVGDFTFAVWDTQGQKLFCARDHFGVKPFYYHHQPGHLFLFASEIRAIFCFDDVPRRLNEIKISDFVLEMFEDRSRTFYADVRRLPSGSLMVVRTKGVRERAYWSLDPTREIRLKSDAEYAEAYRELFVEAVRCRLRSAFPVGSMLSGGLDSSSIACSAHDLLACSGGEKLRTFSIIFDEISASDERVHIHRVLDGRDFRACFIAGDQWTPLADMDRMLWFQEEPFFAPNLFMSWQVWKAVEHSGVRVLLDGFLGDNVISHGGEYLDALARRWRWLALAREVRWLVANANPNGSVLQPLAGYFVQQGLKPYVPEPLMRLWRRLKGYPIDPGVAQCALFTLDYLERVGLCGRLASAYRRDRRRKDAREAHLDALDPGLLQTTLEINNKGCAPFHLETRFPFIDKRLAEFCLAIPGTQKVALGFTRIIARRAMQGILPEAVCWRRDKGYLGWCLINGFQADREKGMAMLDSSHEFLSRYFDASYLSGMRSHLSGARLSETGAMNIFLVLILAAWSDQARVSAVGHLF